MSDNAPGIIASGTVAGGGGATGARVRAGAAGAGAGNGGAASAADPARELLRLQGLAATKLKDFRLVRVRELLE